MAEKEQSEDFDFFAWRDRMRKHTEDRITTEAKKKIAANLVRTSAPNCTEQDVQIFLDPEFQASASDVERSLGYALVEGEIRRVFDGTLAQEDEQEQLRRMQAHHDGIVPILNEYFSEDEIREFCMGQTPNGMVLDQSMALWLVGHESVWGRKIRNAYIPGILEVLSVDPEQGTVEDITHQVLDNGLDGVDTIKELLGGNS